MTEYTITRDDAVKDAAFLRDALAVLDQVGGGVNEEARYRLRSLADDIEAQIPEPAVEEPQDFGSIVQAWHPSEDPSSGPPDLWQMSPTNRQLPPVSGEHYWENRNGVIEVWSDLQHPEVVRVGIGPPPCDLTQLIHNPARFCSLRRDCRMADGHQGACQP
jgi:hypothetical protein